MRQKNLKNILFLVVALQVLCISTAQATMTLDYIRYEYNSDNTAIYASGRSTTELYEIVLQHEIIYYDGKKYIVEGVGPAAFQQGKQRHVVLHKGMNYVKSLAFENSYQLKSITLPSTLTEIGDKAFANCPKLENVYAYYVTPPAVSGTAFSGSATNATLHVPKGTKIAYEESHLGTVLHQLLKTWMSRSSLPNNLLRSIWRRSFCVQHTKGSKSQFT